MGSGKIPRSSLNITTGLTAAKDYVSAGCARFPVFNQDCLNQWSKRNSVFFTWLPVLTDRSCGCSIDDVSHTCTMTSQRWSLKSLLGLTENSFSPSDISFLETLTLRGVSITSTINSDLDLNTVLYYPDGIKMEISIRFSLDLWMKTILSPVIA